MYTPFHDGDKADADTGTKVWQSVANALILLGVICVMTIVLLLLYKFRCYKVTHSLPFSFFLSLYLSLTITETESHFQHIFKVLKHIIVACLIMSSPFLFPFLISFSLFKLILNGKHTKLKHNITLVGFGDILRSFYFLSIKAHFPEHQNLKFQCSMILVLILVLKFGMLDFHLVLK